MGDWEERNPRFPSELSALAAEIRRKGFTPGLWLAPLIVKPSAQLARRHRPWLLQGRGPGKASTGLVWYRWGRALDVTRPEVLNHVRQLIRKVVGEWGFHYLKLDFLYAPAVAGRFADPTVTRAQALRRALEAIREEAGPDTFLLGCGCPLGSGIGVFDAMRIGPDVDFRWFPTLSPISAHLRPDLTFPSARNAVRSTLARAMLHGRWWQNDPDCLLARDRDTQLTREERQTLATAIALSGGALLLSDELGALSADSLRLAQVLLPPNTRAPEVVKWDQVTYPELLMLPLSGAVGRWKLAAYIELVGPAQGGADRPAFDP